MNGKKMNYGLHSLTKSDTKIKAIYHKSCSADGYDVLHYLVMGSFQSNYLTCSFVLHTRLGTIRRLGIANHLFYDTFFFILVKTSFKYD